MKPFSILLFILYAGAAYTQSLPDSLPARHDSLPAKTKQLNGVTVSGRKPVIEQRIDRTIFNVANSVATAGADGLEVLRKTPGIIVTNTSISMAGRSTVSVLLNGRLQDMSIDELQGLLKSIPAENIARIEVITTPPARYDAQGNAGLINIVTKKSLHAGLSGNVTGSYEQTSYAAWGGNGNLTYRTGPWAFNVNGSGLHGAIDPQDRYQSFYPGQTAYQDGHTQLLNDFSRFQAGVDYQLSPRQTLGVQYTVGISSPRILDNTWQRVYNNAHSLDSSQFTRSHTYNNGLRHVLDFNYEWQIDSSGRKLMIDGDYFNRRGAKRTDIATDHYVGDGAVFAGFTLNRNGGVQTVRVRALKADVEWPSKAVNLTFGAKASFINNTSDNAFSTWVDTDFIKDPGQSNVFEYRENTQALYISGSRSLKKWELAGGLRGEYTQTKGVSPTLEVTTRRHYIKLFPTVYVKYVVDDDHAFTLNYSRRVERPAFWNLNPFRLYSTPTSYAAGNPFLQPSYSGKLEAGYLLGEHFSAGLFTALYQDLFEAVSHVDTATTSIQTRQENQGNRRDAGFRVNVHFNAGNWWESSVEADGFFTRFSSVFYKNDPVRYDNYSAYLETTNSFYLNPAKTVIISLDAWLTTPEQDGFNKQGTIWSVSSGMKWITAKKKLTLAANFDDIFRSAWTKTVNSYNASRAQLYEGTRLVRLSATWKFGNQKPPRARRKMEEDAR